MSSGNEEISAGALEHGYEPNDIKLKGILGFGIGLFLMVVITFGLMWALIWVFAESFPEKRESSPMAMSAKEHLPPEPRLQLAPGFKVDSPDHGTVNLELQEPSAEYQEMRREWDQKIEKGEVDAKTGAVTAIPIDAAKEKLLEENVKAKTGPDAEKALNDGRVFISDSSAGRVASEKRR